MTLAQLALRHVYTQVTKIGYDNASDHRGLGMFMS
jgi:hypothetical protein